jgi:hypothetical protein
LLYTDVDPKTKGDLWALPMDASSERKPIPFLRTGLSETNGKFSPDSHWIAYVEGGGKEKSCSTLVRTTR